MRNKRRNKKLHGLTLKMRHYLLLISISCVTIKCFPPSHKTTNKSKQWPPALFLPCSDHKGSPFENKTIECTLSVEIAGTPGKHGTHRRTERSVTPWLRPLTIIRNHFSETIPNYIPKVYQLPSVEADNRRLPFPLHL